MGRIVTRENFREIYYDVFQKFDDQLGILTTGTIHDFRCLTIGWGMMGNVWGHPGSALTVYVSPSRYTFEYLQKNEYFSVCFMPTEYHEDVMLLGGLSGRDGDKVSRTRLISKALTQGVGFEQAELTFVCRKLGAQQFDLNCVPDRMREGLYRQVEPHYMYIGEIVDAFGEMK